MKTITIDWLNGLITENTTKAELDKIEFAKKCVKAYKEKEPKKAVGFVAPTLKEVEKYAKEKDYNVDVDKFYDYYTVAEWHDKNGKPIKNWKLKLLLWNNNNKDSNTNNFIHNNYTKKQIKGLITNLDDVEV